MRSRNSVALFLVFIHLISKFNEYNLRPPSLPQKLTGHEAQTTPRPALIGNLPSTLFLQLNDYEIRKGKKIGVTVSYNNHRIFVGNIPKNRDRDDLFEEFSKHARKLKCLPIPIQFL